MTTNRPFSNTITGTDFHDALTGTDQDDLIISGTGYDLMDGGEGSDTYLIEASDYNLRYLDGFSDSGTNGIDVIEASEAGVKIGLLSGFGADSGIEIIDGKQESTIEGEVCDQVWDFSTVEIRNVSAIYGWGGQDTITGSLAADVIYAGEGHDVLNGNDGDDTLYGDAGHDVLNGGNGADHIEGGSGHDVLNGGAGNDQLSGGTGNDILNGGAGDDVLLSDDGFDILDGGDGSDTYLVTGVSNGFVDVYQDTGAAGFDIIEATDSDTQIGIKSGFDASSGIEMIFANDLANVTITGTAWNESWDFSEIQIEGISALDAGAGNDIIIGSEGDDTIIGGQGQDIYSGGLGSDQYIYNKDSGHDIIRENGDGGFDVITFEDVNNISELELVEQGDDLLIIISPTSSILIEGQLLAGTSSQAIETLYFADGSSEVLREPLNDDGQDADIQGDATDNILIGGREDNNIWGLEGNDTLVGGDGYDYLAGGAGNDSLDGGTLDDDLDGGEGDDILTGGTGSDYFIFLDNFGHDTITDFESGIDLLDLADGRQAVTFDQLQLSQSGADTLIIYGDNSITLQNTLVDDITADDLLSFG